MTDCRHNLHVWWAKEVPCSAVCVCGSCRDNDLLARDYTLTLTEWSVSPGISHFTEYSLGWLTVTQFCLLYRLHVGAVWQLQPKVVQTVQQHVSYEFIWIRMDMWLLSCCTHKSATLGFNCHGPPCWRYTLLQRCNGVKSLRMLVNCFVWNYTSLVRVQSLQITVAREFSDVGNFIHSLLHWVYLQHGGVVSLTSLHPIHSGQQPGDSKNHFVERRPCRDCFWYKAYTTSSLSPIDLTMVVAGDYNTGHIPALAFFCDLQGYGAMTTENSV